MTLSTAQQVRLRIGDVPTVFDATYAGDGYLSTFPLPYTNVTSATAYVQGANVWTSTGASFTPGSVAFSGVISANSAFRVRGMYSVFSDDDIDTLITAGGGDVLGASVQAVQTLMFDALKRAVWRAPDGSSYDDRIALSDLRALYDTLVDQQERDAVNAGGFVGWGENQQNY